MHPSPSLRAGRTAAVLITTLAAFVTGMPVLGQASVSARVCGQTTVASHRTAMSIAPENTLAGINAVPSQGSGVVEMDVQWSISGFPILMHDPTVDRTTDGTGTPASLGLAQLRVLSAVDDPATSWKKDPRFLNEKVPYGWDFMNAVAKNDLDAILDIHAAPTQDGMTKLVAYIDKFEWRSRTVLMGPTAWVQSMRTWFPDLRYGIIEYPPAGRTYTPEYLQSVGVEFYALPIKSITPDLVSYIHTETKVYTWTSDSSETDVAANWRKAYDYGADVLITNDPAGALAACDS